MGHRIGIWLVCQLLYCLLSCGCICIYRVARCVCECVTVWVIVWVSAFVLFHSWKRAIIAQPNITDLILDRTTEWPQSNGEWRMATWFLQQISLFRYCVKTQHYSKIYAACVVCGWGLWFQILSTLTLASAFGIRHRHPHRLPHRHLHRCLLILWWRQKISFLAAHSHSLPDSQPDSVHNAVVPFVLIIIGIPMEARVCCVPLMCCEFSLAPFAAFLLDLALWNFPPVYGAYVYTSFVT